MDSSAIVHSEMSKLSNETGESEIDISYFIVPQVIQKVESESDESSDHFFTEDLVWPDPENVFPKSSGIKPSVLTAELKHLNVGGMELQPKTMCQAALIVRKRPRPKSLPWNVVIIESDPPIIEADDVEEYLVHDPLFVEFFNAFLALPSFPEAVYFNIESGGFEVVTDGKLKLAQQIKEAVRSQMTKVDIYESVQQHAFSDIPVVPIEDTQGPVEEQIERTFDVMALNKEQGILWVKSNRLPKFLESDFYFQYRLAKVISQASIFNDKGEFVVMKIDYTTKSKTQKKAVEIHPPTQEELIIKEMFVSFGDLKGAAKEAWFTQAKKHLKTEVTFSSMSQRYSSLTAGGDAQPSATPRKKSSVFNSHYFGVYSPGLKGPNDMDPPVYDSSKMKDSGILRDRPFTPRPSDRIHAATPMLRAKLSSDPTADEEMIPAGNVVFVWPKQDQQNISAESELEDQAGRETEFARRMREHQIIDQIYNDSSWEEGGTGNIVLKSVDELGSVIVGAVMKKTVAEMLHVNEDTVLSDPYISGIYPSKDLTCVSVDKLNLCVVMEASENKDSRMSPNASPTDEYNSDGEFPDKQPVHIQWHKSIIKPAEEDSEEESLLDSDEDFEERDEHFRRRKDKWHSLTSLKGIQAFKKFLVGTQGEKYWELWIDIDKGRLICSEEEKQKYILHMRDKFYKKGAQFELSAENKRKLKLENLSHWTPEYLFQVQANVLEPLVLYWAPRYLLSHLIHTSPEKYYLYNELKAATFFPASDPYPNTQELLPLRPKSCCPKNRLGLGFGEMNYNMYMTDTKDLRTAPRVGNRRIYSQDTIKRLAKTPTAKYLRKMEASKTPAVPPRQGIPDLFVNLPPVKKSPPISKSASTKSSKVALSDVSELLSRNPSSVIPFAQKRELSAGSVTAIPCPYNSLAVLFGSKEGQHSAKIPKNLPPPLVKSGDINGDKCRGIKLVPIKKSDSEDTANYTFFRQDSKETSKSCQMYLSSLTQSQVPTEDAESWECEFLSSKRLEMLLQALHHEQDSGRTFRKFIISSKREDWLNNLDFWEKVQAYRKLFYKDKLDLHLITKHARSIFAQCIVEGAPQSINVSEDIKLFILDHLNPPYEDLFDRAEENALRMLFEAFQLYMQQDVMSYCEVERTLKECRLETRNANILKLQKLGLIKERPLTPDDPMEGYVDPVYDDSVLQRVPEQFKNWNMAKLAQNKLELEYFRQFLIPRFAEIDLKCWMDMEAWRRTAPDDSSLRDQRAIEIKKNYLNKKYFFGPNSPAGKDGQNKVMEVGGGWGKFLEDKPHFNSVLKAQKYVRARLENKHLPFFLLTRDFQERHLIDSSMIPEDEDTYMFNQKRSIALMKMLSEGEDAFDTVIDKKDKLFVDLHYWTAGGQDRSSLRVSDIDAISSQTSFTRSERSIMSTHHVLPPIASEKTLVPSILTSRASVTPGQTFKQPPKSAQQSVKPKYTTRGVRLPAKESGMPLKAKERFDKKQSFSRWDILLEKHAKLITPMGLIEHVMKEPSEFSEHFESRWVTAIREIFLLQRALKNPTSCSQFKKFVSLSGGFLENDILFWLEVQKYKKMHKRKRHNDAPMQRKVNAIINCFINSYLPPALQIDIPQEMANDILEHRFEMEPTLFQKAGLTVFRGLLPQWVAFREHHRKIFGVDRIEKTLDRHRAVALSKEQKYREKLAQDREIERQVRMQPLSQAEEHEEHEEGMGKDDAAFHYAEYLAQQGILTEGQILASFMAKETQTVRPRQDSAVCDLGFSKNGDDVASIHNGDLDSDARRTSSASSQKKSSDVPSAISKLRTGDSRESPQRTKSVGFVNPTTVT